MPTTCPFWPRGFKGLSLRKSRSPAALPTRRLKLDFACHLTCSPGCRRYSSCRPLSTLILSQVVSVTSPLSTYSEGSAPGVAGVDWADGGAPVRGGGAETGLGVGVAAGVAWPLGAALEAGSERPAEDGSEGKIVSRIGGGTAGGVDCTERGVGNVTGDGVGWTVGGAGGASCCTMAGALVLGGAV